jgi:WD40 repeat protein
MILLQGHADQIEDIQFLGNPAEPLRVLTGSRDKSARIWDPRFESGTGQGREILSLRRHTLGITAVDVTDDGKLLMTGSRDGSVILWPAVGQEQ